MPAERRRYPRWATRAGRRYDDPAFLSSVPMHGAKSYQLFVATDDTNTKAYYIWSQRYRSPAVLGDPPTWIATVDPSRPTRLLTAPRPIIAPTLGFEEHLSEGGLVQRHDGRIHLIYSGSGVSPTYAVGGVWAREDADLTRIDS